ncbi:MAG: YggS family pyridoxal phosphate-dependent enzyme [Chitinophagaceae bacterium]|nr:YggS family pyridoxal phosphate-dependent enzyme [Chitinophagaceae bacterium]
MLINQPAFEQLKSELASTGTTLIAVSKTKPVEAIQELYDLGQRDFGENYVQELVEKQPLLPEDIRWHFIGHLQSNKVKYIAPFVYLIHGVDSLKLLKEINKQTAKLNRTIRVLLQVHIATEETKFGMDEAELAAVFLEQHLNHVQIGGLMGMASFTDDMEKVRQEFTTLAKLAETYRDHFKESPAILSMGMSGDYKIAIECGSTMIRIGSMLFGARNYPQNTH